MEITANEIQGLIENAWRAGEYLTETETETIEQITGELSSGEFDAHEIVYVVGDFDMDFQNLFPESLWEKLTAMVDAGNA